MASLIVCRDCQRARWKYASYVNQTDNGLSWPCCHSDWYITDKSIPPEECPHKFEQAVFIAKYGESV
jgi:hypothetical protein